MTTMIRHNNPMHFLTWVCLFAFIMIFLIPDSHAESFPLTLKKDEEYRSEHNLSADDDFNIYSINLDLTESQNEAPKSIIFLFTIRGNGSFQIAFGIGTYDESHGYPENFTSGDNVSRFAKVYFIEPEDGTEFVILVNNVNNESITYSVFIELYFYKQPQGEGWISRYINYALMGVAGFSAIIWALAYWRYRTVPGSFKIFRRNKTDAESGMGTRFGLQQKLTQKATAARKNVLPRRADIKATCPYCKMHMKSVMFQYFTTKLIFQDDQTIPEFNKSVNSVRVKAIICEGCGRIFGFIK